MSDDARPAPKRRKLTPIVLIVLVNLLGAGAFAYHKATQARLRANTRACFANQKQIAGAIEMAQLDHNLKFDKQQFNADFVAFLQNGSYLRNVPWDTGGGGSGSWKHYQLDPRAPLGVRCVVHGAVPHYDDKNPPPPQDPVVPPPPVKTPARGLTFPLPKHYGEIWTKADRIHEDALALREP